MFRYGQCSKLCGKDHSNLPIAFPGVSEESYAAWLARTRKKCAAADPAPGHLAANDAATAERPWQVEFEEIHIARDGSAAS
jgi:cytochrome c oxidase subunit 2